VVNDLAKKIESAAVVVNGAIEDYTWARSAILACDFVIAVDGGGNHLHAMGLFPDLVVGDLDSIAPAAKESFTEHGCVFMTFPSAKDESDLQLAMDHAASLHPRQIFLLGALGKRFDHAYGNVLLLNLFADRGIHAFIVDETHEIQVITSRANFDGMVNDTLSLFSLTPETRGVATSGMVYPLKHESLYMGDTRGLSNIIKDPEASVSLETGRLLAIRIRKTSSNQ
jgi:thiamine pyrophosphokinase